MEQSNAICIFLSGSIECTFYGDKYLRQRIFFEEWQKFIVKSTQYEFYDDYIGTWTFIN